MFGVTPMVYSNNRHEVTQTEFGGYDHRAAASDGAIYDGWNMCADRYPALTTRRRRGWGRTVTKPNGLYVRDCVVWVDGDQLVVDEKAVATLTDGKKLMVGVQKKICVWPDKVIWDREAGTLTQMEAQWAGDVEFNDGTYAGESALANTIYAPGDLTGLFRAGDGVVVQTVEGGLYSEVMGAYVIQEIEYDSDADETELRFFEETWRRFVAESEGTETDDGMSGFPGVGSKYNVVIRRRVPALEMVFEHHNRLWGVEGRKIKCCALGDPTNWEVFDGLSTDAWELELGSAGEVTGCCSFGGRPMFFKENLIATIYGDTPQTFSLSQEEALGVETGSGGSLAVAAQTLFYKSPAGVVAYSGGYPRSIAEAFGEVRYKDAVAGSDGVKYYVSMEDYGGVRKLFVYDTRYGVWHREDGAFVAFGRNKDLLGMWDPKGEDSPGLLQILSSPGEMPSDEQGLSSRVEFADFTDGTTRKKGVGKLILRLEVEEGTELTISVQYDSNGTWVPVKKIVGTMVKGQTEVTLSIRRCDHYRIRIDGNGLGGSGWTLHALTRDRFVGSNRK